MNDLYKEIIQKYGLRGVVAFIILFLLIWLITHLCTAPGGKISVLFGIVEYTKMQDNIHTGMPSFNGLSFQNKKEPQSDQEMESKQLQPTTSEPKPNKDIKDSLLQIEQKSEGGQSQNIVTNGNVDIRFENE